MANQRANKWLVVQSAESYNTNPRVVSLPVKYTRFGEILTDKRGELIPAVSKYSKIKSGDLIIYYMKHLSAIKGIYWVIDKHHDREARLPLHPLQFNIHPFLELKESQEIRPILDSLDFYSRVEDKKHWGLALKGTTNAVRELSEKDYRTIQKVLFNQVDKPRFISEQIDTSISEIFEQTKIMIGEDVLRFIRDIINESLSVRREEWLKRGINLDDAGTYHLLFENIRSSVNTIILGASSSPQYGNRLSLISVIEWIHREFCGIFPFCR
jgi:hypothetical protein